MFSRNLSHWRPLCSSTLSSLRVTGVCVCEREGEREAGGDHQDQVSLAWLDIKIVRGRSVCLCSQNRLAVCLLLCLALFLSYFKTCVIACDYAELTHTSRVIQGQKGWWTMSLSASFCNATLSCGNDILHSVIVFCYLGHVVEHKLNAHWYLMRFCIPGCREKCLLYLIGSTGDSAASCSY